MVKFLLKFLLAATVFSVGYTILPYSSDPAFSAFTRGYCAFAGTGACFISLIIVGSGVIDLFEEMDKPRY